MRFLLLGEVSLYILCYFLSGKCPIPPSGGGSSPHRARRKAFPPFGHTHASIKDLLTFPLRTLGRTHIPQLDELCDGHHGSNTILCATARLGRKCRSLSLTQWCTHPHHQILRMWIRAHIIASFSALRGGMVHPHARNLRLVHISSRRSKSA